MPAFKFLESLARNLGEPYPTRALTPLYVKTVVQAAKSAAWRAR